MKAWETAVDRLVTLLPSRFIAVTISLCGISLLQGCIKSSETFRSPQYRATYKSSELDNCSLITKADVEAELNQSCSGPHLVAEFKGTEESDPITFCSYVSSPENTGPIVFVDIEVHGVPTNKSTSREVIEKFKKRALTGIQVIPGLGDAAYWRNIGTDTFPVIELYTVKEDKVLLKISILGIPHESIALDKTKALARKALARF